jgi:hypothetical protein
MARPGWPRMSKIGIKAFSGVAWPNLGGRGCYKMVSEPWFTILSFDGPGKWLMKQRFQSELLSRGTKYEPQNVPKCKKASCEHWDCVQNLRRYNCLWNGNRERSHKTHCIGSRCLKLGRRIYSGGGRPFTTVRSGKKVHES